MIGPGTGIAPMRSILWNRISHGAKCTFLILNLANALFFGCRNSSKDFLYQEELEAASKSQNLLLFTSFSRDQESKIYVQDILFQQKELVWNWINLGAFIYISG